MLECKCLFFVSSKMAAQRCSSALFSGVDAALGPCSRVASPSVYTSRIPACLRTCRIFCCVCSGYVSKRFSVLGLVSRLCVPRVASTHTPTAPAL